MAEANNESSKKYYIKKTAKLSYYSKDILSKNVNDYPVSPRSNLSFVDGFPSLKPSPKNFHKTASIFTEAIHVAQTWGGIKITIPNTLRQEFKNWDIDNIVIPRHNVQRHRVNAIENSSGLGWIQNTKISRSTEFPTTYGELKKFSTEKIKISDFWTSPFQRYRSHYVVDLQHSQGSLLQLSGIEDLVNWAPQNLPNNIFSRADVNLPGFSSPYLYMGTAKSGTGIHIEDGATFSMNTLIDGQPKYWFFCTPKAYPVVRTLCSFAFPEEAAHCSEFIQHKSIMANPTWLQQKELEVNTVVQNPGDIIITYPHAYHWVINGGANLAEAVSFGNQEWWDKVGKFCNRCDCRNSTAPNFRERKFKSFA